MELAKRQLFLSSGATRFSPISGTGSFFVSLALHGFIAASVVGMMGLKFFEKEAAPVYMDLGYETFDEPPPIVKEVRPVARTKAPETPVETKAPVTNAPQELQDEKSDVAGTQAAAKNETAPGSEGVGAATAVPYYKIKPKYPKAALLAGEEGWVMFKVDVNEGGEVENIRVIDGEKKNLFQDEARRALSKWKYRPFTDTAGNAIRKTDHNVRVDFKLEDAS
jgi:TonB family protein